MIAILAPLGATFNIQIVPDFDKEGNVSVTVLLTPKDKGKMKGLTFSGPIAEVEQAIAEKLPTAVNALTGLTTNIAELDAQIAEEKKAKEEELKAEKAKRKGGSKPEKKEPEKKPEPKAKPSTKSAKLTPSWKKQADTPAAPAPAPVPSDLGELFEEIPAPETATAATTENK